MIHIKDLKLLYLSEERRDVIFHWFLNRPICTMSDLVKNAITIYIDNVSVSIAYKVPRTNHIFLSGTDREEITNIDHRTIPPRKRHSDCTIRMVSDEIFLAIAIRVSESEIIEICTSYIDWFSESLIESCNRIYLIIWEINDWISEIDGQIICMIANRARPFLSCSKLEKRSIIPCPSETRFVWICRPSLVVRSSEIA